MTHTLRPLTLGEVLDRTFFFYRTHFVIFVGIAALPQLVMLAFGLVMIRTAPVNPTSLASLMATFGTRLGTMFSVILLAMVVTTITQAATVVAVSQLHLDRPIAIGQAFASIRERIFELVLITIGVGMLIFLCVAVVAFAFVVPGLVLSLQWLSVLGMIVGTAVGGVAGVLLALRWSLVVPAAVLEHVGIRLAMARSVDLTTGQRGRIFVVYVLFVVLTMVFTSIWQVPVMVAVFTAGKAGPPLWTQIVTQVGSFVTGSVASPLMTIAIALMYYDARVRKEAFDLEHMLSQLDQPAGASELPA